MIGRSGLLSFVAAAGIAQCLPAMPDASGWAMLAVGAALMLCMLPFLPRRLRWSAGMCIVCGCAGFALTTARIEHRLADALTPDNDNRVSRVVLRVAGLPRLNADSRQFDADVLSSIPGGVPSRIQVTWSSDGWHGPYGAANKAPAEFPEILPGQVWRMALTLKRPHGARNPHGFDYEGLVFARGVRATASVRGTPRLLDDQPFAGLAIAAERARHHVREAMLPHLEGTRYGPVLTALAIGDQAGVAAEDWDVFNRTGITHLVSISGSHITMIAAFGGVAAHAAWRRLSWRGRLLAERWPARLAAALAALIVAWLYCLLAGWGVPARRTFIMLAVVAGAALARLPLGGSHVLLLAAFVVVLLDPWALLASGFWLSFGAVAVLMACAGQAGAPLIMASTERWRRWRGALAAAAGLQLAITFGVMPVLASIFHEVSLVSPLVNAYAIPLISLIVTPLALLLAGLAMLPGSESAAAWAAWLGHGVLDAMMQPTVWLAKLQAASFVAPAAPAAVLAAAGLGLALALAPPGLPYRWAGWLFMLPSLCWRPAPPPAGAWDLHALDVGQGGAIVVRTARHVLLFDTGLRSGPTSDEGQRSIRPFLHAIGARRIDALVVSHADIDHAGGIRSLLQTMPVRQAYASFDLPAYLSREAGLLGKPGQLPPMPAAVSSCAYGTAWTIDDVVFEFLWPLPPESFGAAVAARTAQARTQRNDGGCVLRIRGRHHSLLLPGDVGAGQEAALVDRGLASVDVVLAAHHGSRTSSSAAFVDAAQAAHVIAQVGARNRYGHPHPAVERRWTAAGAAFWRTDRHGAVTVRSRAEGLQAHAERQVNRRHWQGD